MNIQLHQEVKEIFEEMKKFPQVDAIAIAGSRASGNNDNKSDYDIYVYTSNNDFLPEEVRNQIYEKYCSVYETGNKYFEYEDNCILKNGVPIDVIFRKIEMIERSQSYVVDKHTSMLGYTTAFWHTLNVSYIYFDKSGKLTELKEKYNIPYPQQLKKNIIKKNMNMLSGVLPSYDKQIRKAVERNDLVSICHRTAEYMASYFDVIFALNEMTHPGEKKLVEICKSKCSILPKDFEENITALYSSMYNGYNFEILEKMYNNLKQLTDNI